MLNDEPKEKIDHRAIKVWFINGLAEGIALIVVVMFFIIYVQDMFELSSLWGQLGALLVVVYTIWVAVIAPYLRLRFWRYEIRENEVDIQYGIFIKHRTLIPMTRIQHVDTEYGPVMRHFGLSTLKISTAATDHRIPALSKKRASELMGQISELARVSDEDV